MLLKYKQILFYCSVALCGALFSIGLQVSSMVNPTKVRGFLDITGLWDPSLALVLAAALLVFSLGFWLLIQPKITQNSPPVFSDAFCLPSRKTIDLPLISGAVLFGAGWGISGLCPGPAIANLHHLDAKILLFFITMLVGMKLAAQLKN